MTIAAHRRREAVGALVRREDGRRTLMELTPPLPEDVGRWLARLCLLESVPFEVCVPDARLLPTEAIRFFVVDQNWLDALIDGALSIAVRDAATDTIVDLHRFPLRAATRKLAEGERRRRLGRVGADSDDAEPIWTGFVLRSALVEGWPELTVTAHLGKVDVPLLRLDRMGAGVLVALFAGPVDEIWLTQPATGLHFGVVRDVTGPDTLDLRWLGGDNHPVGEHVPGTTVDVPWRDRELGVLDVAELSKRLREKLNTAYDPSPSPPLGAGGFAVELVRAPSRQPFRATFEQPSAAASHDGSEAQR